MLQIGLPPGVVEGPGYGTDSWSNARRGRVTASRFADVMPEPRSIPKSFQDRWRHLVPESERTKVLKSGPRAGQIVDADGLPQRIAEEAASQHGAYAWSDGARGYMMELLASSITGIDRVGGRSAAMDRGVDMESDAIDAYALAKFTEVAQGRLLLRTDGLLAATPDGFVEDDPDGPGLVEVKCPESKRHMETWLTREIPEEYVEQVQGQMWIAGRAWCDFISYDDRFPAPMRLVIIRVKRDDQLIARMDAKVGAFAMEVANRLAEVRGYLRESSPEQADAVHQALKDAVENVTSSPEA